MKNMRARLAESEELKSAEITLRSESRYRMLFTCMIEGFGFVEVIYNNCGNPYDYHYLEINPAFELYLGIKREEVLGKTMLELFPNTTQTTIEKFGKVALTGQSTQYEAFGQEANRYIDVYAFSPEKGKFALIFRNITGRKQAEEAIRESRATLKAAIESMTDAVFISDLKAISSISTMHSLSSTGSSAKKNVIVNFSSII